MVQDIVPENEYDPCSRLESEVICRDFGCVEYCEFLGVGKVCRCFAIQFWNRLPSTSVSKSLTCPKWATWKTAWVTTLFTTEWTISRCMPACWSLSRTSCFFSVYSKHVLSILRYARFLHCTSLAVASFLSVTSSIPFVVVPRPFIIGEYRVTPSCIVLATAACRLCVEGFL